jgi:hypothetical protein
MSNGTSLSQFSNYAELAVMNWTFTTSPMTGTNVRPTAWFLGLSTSVPTSTGGITEPPGNGYSRKSVTFSQSGGNPALCTNFELLEFTASGGDWGTILYALVFDALTLGHCWCFGPLASPKVIDSGDTIRFQPSSLAVGIR